MAGISLNAIVGDNGIINKAEKAKEETDKSSAKEKLEMELLNLNMDKSRDSNYNQKEYIDKRLTEKGMMVSDNMVLVDGWLFEIDRKEPEIKECLGKGQTTDKITINLDKTLNSNYSNATITGKILSQVDIELIMFGGKQVDFVDNGGGNYNIEQVVNNNGSFSVLVKDSEGKFQIKSILVEGITEDMDIYNKADMEKFRDNVNSGMTYEDKTVRVMENIDLGLTETLSWEPINGFNGTFYGNDFEIQNLYISGSKENSGLFGNTGEKSHITNVIIANGKITNNAQNTGAIVGNNNGTMENCENRIQISGASYMGGIAGRNNYCGNVKNCINQSTGSINGSGVIGGIIGLNEGNVIRMFKLWWNFSEAVLISEELVDNREE